jgi:DNA-binding NtrC family response regulator
MQRVIPRLAWIGGNVSASLLDSQIARAASQAGPVLIVGEPGVGKRLAAKRIHAQSSRGGRFLATVSRQVPPSLLDVELFGGAGGCFRHVTGPPSGRLEQARLGTCYVEDIDVLSPECQELLLRYLRTGEVRCLDTWFRPPPARVVVATTPDRWQPDVAGTFSEELRALTLRKYHRLAATS